MQRTVRGYLVELVVIFVGVALAFAVENLREDLNERAVGDRYLNDFRQDLQADAQMLQAQIETRRTQLKNALTVLEFYEGRAVEPQLFFEAFYPAMLSFSARPNRNTLTEVLNSGSLRLIRDDRIRTGLLDLYATYDDIAATEAHMARDFDVYLYDPTFSSIPLQLEGPWEDTPDNRRLVETVLDNLTIENGMRLLVANLRFPQAGLLSELEAARSQVESLLELIPAE